MLRYVLIRILLFVPTMLGILLLSFALVQFVPGGPVERLVAELQIGGAGEVSQVSDNQNYLAYQGMSDDQLAAIKKYYGFDKTVSERFIDMAVNYLTFDFGESYYHNSRVSDLLISKLPVSASLGLWAFFITYLIALPLGIRKAVKDGTTFDIWSSVVLLFLYSIPGFILAILLLTFFGGGGFLSIFPLRGLTSDNWNELGWYMQILDYFWHLFLPLLCSILGGFAFITLLFKNSIIEELNKQYVLFARAKGLKQNYILYRHVLPNAIIPIITGFPTQFIFAFISGNLLIEIIFSLDGLGLLGYESAINRDFPVLLAEIYLFALLAMGAKLITDIAYVWIDPRISFEKNTLQA